MKKHLDQIGWVKFIQAWINEVAVPYYQALAVREQYVLCFAAIALPLMLFVFEVILPLNDAKMNKQQALQELQQQALKAEILSNALQKEGGGKKQKNSMEIVDSTAKKVQVQKFITRMRPQMGVGSKQRLLIQMHSAPYSKTVDFLQRLSKQGLSLLSVKLQRDKQSGLVHVQVIVE